MLMVLVNLLGAAQEQSRCREPLVVKLQTLLGPSSMLCLVVSRNRWPTCTGWLKAT